MRHDRSPRCSRHRSFVALPSTLPARQRGSATPRPDRTGRQDRLDDADLAIAGARTAACPPWGPARRDLDGPVQPQHRTQLGDHLRIAGTGLGRKGCRGPADARVLLHPDPHLLGERLEPGAVPAALPRRARSSSRPTAACPSQDQPTPQRGSRRPRRGSAGRGWTPGRCRRTPRRAARRSGGPRSTLSCAPDQARSASPCRATY